MYAFTFGKLALHSSQWLNNLFLSRNGLKGQRGGSTPTDVEPGADSLGGGGGSGFAMLLLCLIGGSKVVEDFRRIVSLSVSSSSLGGGGGSLLCLIGGGMVEAVEPNKLTILSWFLKYLLIEDEDEDEDSAVINSFDLYLFSGCVLDFAFVVLGRVLGCFGGDLFVGLLGRTIAGVKDASFAFKIRVYISAADTSENRADTSDKCLVQEGSVLNTDVYFAHNLSK
jgi:hypothetical protein